MSNPCEACGAKEAHYIQDPHYNADKGDMVWLCDDCEGTIIMEN